MAHPSPNDSSAEEEGEESKYSSSEDLNPRGLVGLRNLGLTCYMNAALQALSNSVPLCQFMRDCPSFLHLERKQHGVVRPFHKLISEMWDQPRTMHMAPSLVYHSFRTLYPMFRPYSQQDSQEFLRYFMDQLHEELREPFVPLFAEQSWDGEEADDENESSSNANISDEDDSEGSSPEGEGYETCDSGVSDRTGSSSRDSILSDPSLQHKAKRKKRHHNPFFDSTKWSEYGVGSGEPDQSEFSDAMSDTCLLDPKSTNMSHIETHSKNSATSVVTSGLGSSKPPSYSSIASSGKSKSYLHSKSHAGHFQVGLCSRPPNTQKMGLRSTTSRKKKPVRYRSVISDSFDGVLVSSVQCLTCNTISSRKETFQDLSLPIPSSDQLNFLQQHPPQQQKPHATLSPSQNSSFNIYLSKNACDVTGEGWMWLWIWSVWGWVRSWLWGPSVSLSNCLAAFFSADELKGDNMYSCEKCGKLRNGVKYSKVIQLPEILIIHLKRFRHEYMFSSKISQYVSFPMHGLDLSQFLHKDCTSEVRSYDLYSVICHHGAVGSGHYTAYAQNAYNNRWFEFDDQCVTEVSEDTVANCEAYVLFYKKVSPEMPSRRIRTMELMQVSTHEPSLMQFYVSKQWINKFNTFAEPGFIDNSDFLCPHGGVQPSKASYVTDLVIVFSQGVWEYLHQVFGGGPACTSLYECATCREEQDALLHRQKLEHETFIQLHGLFREEEHPDTVCAISMKWFRTWEAFVLGRQQEPPGSLDNSSISMNKCGQVLLKPGSDYAPISKEMWNFFYDIYGGGPELYIRCGNPQTASYSPARRESYDDRSSAMREREEHVPETHLTYGLKSLSTDDIPYCFVFNQQSRSAGARQRTFSASEVVSSSECTDTVIRNTKETTSSEEERKVIKWTDVENEEERCNEDSHQEENESISPPTPQTENENIASPRPQTRSTHQAENKNISSFIQKAENENIPSPTPQTRHTHQVELENIASQRPQTRSTHKAENLSSVMPQTRTTPQAELENIASSGPQTRTTHQAEKESISSQTPQTRSTHQVELKNIASQRPQTSPTPQTELENIALPRPQTRTHQAEPENITSPRPQTRPTHQTELENTSKPTPNTRYNTRASKN